MLLTMVIPVMAHITTVSQNVPVIETSPCCTGEMVFADAAAIGTEPSPASLVNRPLEIPTRMAVITAVPVIPPAREREENAEPIITLMVSDR